MFNRIKYLLAVFFSCFFMLSCSNELVSEDDESDNNRNNYYYVSFYDNGIIIDELGETVASGTTITLPTRTKAGYTFDGWLLNNTGAPINGMYKVTDNLSFYAKFTLSGAILIYSAQDLYNVRDNLSGEYMLANDISLSGYNSGSGWEPIGSQLEPFAGVLDGNGFKITELYVDRYIAGLFGYLTDGAEIKNLTVKISAVTGVSYAGGIAGRIYATSSGNQVIISNSYVAGTGAVKAENSSGDAYSGGIAGHTN
jgi:uncharacterized repeat protein (TIGR02543 family)